MFFSQVVTDCVMASSETTGKQHYTTQHQIYYVATKIVAMWIVERAITVIILDSLVNFVRQQIIVALSSKSTGYFLFLPKPIISPQFLRMPHHLTHGWQKLQLLYSDVWGNTCCHNSGTKVKLKILLHQISSFCPFCMNI